MKILVLSLLILGGTLASAQDRPTVAAQPNTVYVSADGKFETDPDTAVIEFNISAQENTSPAAYDRASKAAEQIRQILRNNGIDPHAAQLSNYTTEPIYDERPAKRKLVAYRVSVSVCLKLKDFTKVAPIVQQLSDADITDTQSVRYILEDIDAAKTKAVDDAYRRARASADAIARAGGRTLGELLYASVDTFEPPRVYPMAQAAGPMTARAPTPAPTEQFGQQTATVTAHVNAVFSLK